MRRFWFGLATMGVLFLPGGAVARDLDQESLFAEGNRLYQEGDFAAAAASYGAVIEGGFESAEVYYNLGNAHFRLGETARAVLNYRRAARLDPANDDIRANLALVNQRLQDRIEPLPRFWLLSVFDWWMGLIPGGVLQALVAACYLLLGGTVVLIVLRRPAGVARAVAPLRVRGGGGDGPAGGNADDPRDGAGQGRGGGRDGGRGQGPERSFRGRWADGVHAARGDYGAHRPAGGGMGGDRAGGREGGVAAAGGAGSHLTR